MIHRAKGFGIVNKAEVDFFSGTLLLFSMTQWMLAIGSLVPLLFLNPAWTSGSSWFTYYWSLAWRILSITLLAWRLFKSKVGNSHEGRSQKSHSCLPENPHPASPFHFHQDITGGHLHGAGCTFIPRQTWESDWFSRPRDTASDLCLSQESDVEDYEWKTWDKAVIPTENENKMTKQNQPLKTHTWGRRLPCLMCVLKAHLFVEVIIRKAGYH